MNCVVLTQHRSTVDLLRRVVDSKKDDLSFLVEDLRLERYLHRSSLSVSRGKFRDRAVYEKLELTPNGLIVVHLRDNRRLRGILKVIDVVRNGCSVLVLHTDPLVNFKIESEDFPFAQFLPLADSFRPIFHIQTRLAKNKKRLKRIQEITEGAKKLLILVQDDPDPDALGTALALRHLLARNRSSTPIATFGKVTRPENLAMTRLLDIQLIENISAGELEDYDRIACVDTQPSRFKVELPRIDIIIDHHPEAPGCQATFKDIRPSYGATATILTEYLRAKKEKIAERIATALLYGIRTDTLLLDRGVVESDVEAFTYLYPRANINTIRRIERPELPVNVLDSFSEGLRNRRITDKVIFSHLGKVKREDVIPQLADFCLQVEGVEWSVVSGIYGGDLILSVRNVGFVRAAGDIMKEAFAHIGSAGGHRSMAKAVIPLKNLVSNGKKDIDEADLRKVQNLFLKPLRSAAKSNNSNHGANSKQVAK